MTADEKMELSRKLVNLYTHNMSDSIDGVIGWIDGLILGKLGATKQAKKPV